MKTIDKNADMFCFGLSKGEIPWAELEEICPTVKEKYRKVVEEYEKYPNRFSNFLYVQLAYGWHGKHLAVLLPQEEKESEMYFKNVFCGLAHMMTNLNYKRKTLIEMHTSTLGQTSEKMLEQCAKIAENKEKQQVRFSMQL